jgi:hypothetical protein
MAGYHGLGRIVRLYMFQMLASHVIAFKVVAATRQTATILKSMQSTGIHSIRMGNQGMYLPFNWPDNKPLIVASSPRDIVLTLMKGKFQHKFCRESDIVDSEGGTPGCSSKKCGS